MCIEGFSKNKLKLENFGVSESISRVNNNKMSETKTMLS